MIGKARRPASEARQRTRPRGWGSIVAAAALSVALQTAVQAGKNKNGALIVHTNDAYTYSASTACSTPSADPGTCAAAVTRSDKSSGTVVWLLAAFLPSASPGVAGIYFGIDYDDLNLDPGVAYRACGPPGTLDLPDPDWPYAGRGNTIAFGTPIVGDVLFPFYVFRIDGGTAGSFFGTAVNPLAGFAEFIDDSGAPGTDRCSRFGQVRWYQAGSNNCPVPSTCALTVTSPNTAVTWLQGTLNDITWTSSQCGSAVAIELLLNDVVCATITSETPNNGHYGWVAQQCNGASSGYKIRITDLDAGNSDDSNASFSIPSLGCQVNVTAPNGGERFTTGSPIDIVWGSTSCGANVKVELVKNGNVCKLISGTAPNTGTFPWTAESCGIEECTYKIRVTDLISSHADESDAPFCIRPCTVEVASPNGGEQWSPGMAQTITWTSAGCGENVKVELLQNGAACATIAEQTANDGSLPWTVQPCAGASGYRVRITDTASGLYDDSDADFCIGCGDVFSIPTGLQFTIGQQEAEIQVQGGNIQALKGYSVHLCFDPSVLECLDMTLEGTRGAGAVSLEKICSAGCAQATVGYSSSCPPQIAPGAGTILKVRFRVKPDAPIGPTSIDLTDLQGGLNRVTPCSAPAFAPQLVDATVEILPKRFRRGDDNADGTMSIADPLYCLTYQYGGGAAPPCADAGDFDDSGRYDLADCIGNLCRQFAGCGNPPAPFETCGPDPTTQDPLGCGSFPPCGTLAAPRALPLEGFGASAARLQCTPIISGDTLRIAVEASAGQPAVGLQFDLTFDPAVVRFQGIERDAVDIDFFSARHDPATGLLRVGCVPDLEMRTPLPAGPRMLGEILFCIQSPPSFDESRIEITDALFVTPDLGTLSASSEGLTIRPGSGTPGGDSQSPRLTLPNPLPPHGTMRLRLAHALPVRLDIFSIQGRHLRTLFEGELARGEHPFHWDGRTEEGAEATAGIYCLRATIGTERIDRKFVRVR